MVLEQVGSPSVLFNLVPLVVFFPVIGLLLNILFGKRIGEAASGAIASIAVGASFVMAVLLAVALAGQPGGATVPFLDWIHIGDLNVPWSFRVDTLSVTMMLVVSGIGTLIHIYSIGYMHEDVRIQGDPGRFRRFFVYMNLFIAAMMVLVSGASYLMLFVGWEGVGLCSYLLIGFWFEKGKDGIGNALAAKKAFIVNRIGDFGFLIAMFLMFWAFKSLEFDQIFSQAQAVAQAMPNVILAITLFMLLAVTGKSAQIPLYVWLPDAMAGPTPVSALIHAATMVTAGVYLVTRSYVLYSLVPQAQNIVALVGAVTALFAATIAIGQFDIKKVLAYSTISQLGFMVSAVGMGAYAAGMFHLVAHAFFKALLFLGSGSVILGIERGIHHVEHDQQLRKNAKAQGQDLHEFDPQDMRNMGGLKDRMKTTYWVYVIGALALVGIPIFAGFWSKDEILAAGLRLNPPAYGLLTAAAFLTAFYMGRQVFLVFFGNARSLAAGHAEESAPLMTVPLLVLALLSAFGGFLNTPFWTGLEGWLEHSVKGEPGGLNLTVMAIAIILAVAGIALAWVIYIRLYRKQQDLPKQKRLDDPLRGILGPVFTGMEKKWGVDEFYQAVVVRPYQAFAQFLAYPVDLGVIDGIPNGLGALTRRLANSLRRLQTGYVSNYALAVFLGVVVILGYLILR